MLQQYSIQNVAGIIHANWIQHANENYVTELLIDSRAITIPETSLFFAIVGQRNNGHKYINDLYQKGVRNFVVQEKIDVSELHNANVLEVKDTLHALQMLATNKRRQFQIPVIGITGSNGKTIIKEWLYHLLYSDYNICRSPKSFNSQVGVPLSVWQLNDENTLGIFEAGISQPHEMQLLETLLSLPLAYLPTLAMHTTKDLIVHSKKLMKSLSFSNIPNA